MSPTVTSENLFETLLLIWNSYLTGLFEDYFHRCISKILVVWNKKNVHKSESILQNPNARILGYKSTSKNPWLFNQIPDRSRKPNKTFLISVNSHYFEFSKNWVWMHVEELELQS